MTLYEILMALGLVVVLGTIVKGFWSLFRIRPARQPDDWRRHVVRVDTSLDFGGSDGDGSAGGGGD